MSLSDQHGLLLRRCASALALGALVIVSGCQVRPLYSAGAGTFSSNAAAITSVSVSEVTTRYGQQVRNHLIFLFNGGAGDPASAAYKLDLGITKRVISSAEVQIQTSTERQPSAGAVVMESNYVLTETAGGEVIARGKRSVTSSFDRSRQYFAQSRAERDAEDRAARELAELVRLAVAGELSNR